MFCCYKVKKRRKLLRKMSKMCHPLHLNALSLCGVKGEKRFTEKWGEWLRDPFL